MCTDHRLAGYDDVLATPGGRPFDPTQSLRKPAVSAVPVADPAYGYMSPHGCPAAWDPSLTLMSASSVSILPALNAFAEWLFDTRRLGLRPPRWLRRRWHP